MERKKGHRKRKRKSRAEKRRNLIDGIKCRKRHKSRISEKEIKAESLKQKLRKNWKKERKRNENRMTEREIKPAKNPERDS